MKKVDILKVVAPLRVHRLSLPLDSRTFCATIFLGVRSQLCNSYWLKGLRGGNVNDVGNSLSRSSILSSHIALRLAIIVGWLFVIPSMPEADCQPASLSRLILQQAYTTLRSGDNATARLLFESVIELFPESPEAAESLFRLAHLDIRERYFDDAQRHFEQVVKHPSAHPDFVARAKLQLGFVDIMKFFTCRWWRRETGGEERMVELSKQEAWQHLERAKSTLEAVASEYTTKDSTVVAVAKLGIGEIYLLQKQPRLAERIYWEIVRKWGAKELPLLLLAHYGIGIAKVAQDDEENALEHFQWVIQNFSVGGVLENMVFVPPDLKVKARLWKVNCWMANGQKDKALSEAQVAEQEGRALLAKTNLEIHRQNLRRWITRARLWQGALLREIGRNQEAEKILLDTISEFGDLPESDKSLLLWALEGW